MLDDNGIRPPIIAAGINLFGGPLGLIHRHVTGAMPIRRNTKDPAYLITLKAYVAELLRKHDLFFYPEGGRSYSGELKAPKTGLMHAALQAAQPNLVIVPTAIAYDLVLEDHVLARQRVKRRQRPFSRELAEMVRYAVGYRSRAFVTFGEPIAGRRRSIPTRARAVLDLAHAVMQRDRPALQGAADGARRRGDAAVDHAARARASASTRCSTRCAPPARTSASPAAPRRVDAAAEPLEARGILVVEGGRVRVRDRNVLRYYARSLEHLLAGRARRTH